MKNMEVIWVLLHKPEYIYIILFILIILRILITSHHGDVYFSYIFTSCAETFFEVIYLSEFMFLNGLCILSTLQVFHE